MTSMPLGIDRRPDPSAGRGRLVVHRPRPLRVLLRVEDALVRHGLLHLLADVTEIDVVPDEAELVVLDSIDLVASAGPSSADGQVPRVLLLHDGLDDRDVLDAVRAGVDAVVARTASADEIVEVVRSIGRGEATLDRASAAAVVRALRVEQLDDTPVLSLREQEVVDLVVRGLDNRSIAVRLFIAESTVKFHLRRIRAKLGARSRTELVAIVVGDAAGAVRRSPAPPVRPPVRIRPTRP